MRDPDAALACEGTSVVRTMYAPIGHDSFLRSGLAREWVASGRLVDFELLDDRRLRSPRVPFVTQPDDWCDAQLWDAGELTLQFERDAVAQGYDLKDASAWNVLFDGALPRFCDHSSVVSLQDRRWWAAGQFARHFLLPLRLSIARGMTARQCFAVWRDGVPPMTAASLLGRSRFLTRYWPLMTAPASVNADEPTTAQTADMKSVRSFRDGLHASLGWMLGGVRPHRRGGRPSPWSEYAAHRSHYTGESAGRKRAQVAEWLAATRPAWTADLGCNTGEYAQMAVEAGASVVAVDGDHDAVQALYLRSSGSTGLYPVVADLDDLSGGRGWAGTEHPGLASKMSGAFDLIMMLALLHHLAVGAAIPLAQIASFAAKITRRWVIVGFIECNDPQMRLLCAQRGRRAEDFTVTRQRQAFVDAGFVIEAQLDLAPVNRILALMRVD